MTGSAVGELGFSRGQTTTDDTDEMKRDQRQFGVRGHEETDVSLLPEARIR